METLQDPYAQATAWADQDPDPTTQRALRTLIAARDTQTLSTLFAGRIGFGTAGLRAVMGPGPMAMNRLVVRQSALAVAQVLQRDLADATQRGVVVAYDGRLLSQEMAFDVAGVFAAAGFLVHLFDRAVPTPVAGYAIKQRQSACGIVITASHNPPAYNGMKVFWHTAAQIVPPLDAHIARQIDAVAKTFAQSPIPCWSIARGQEAGKIKSLGQDVLDGYVAAIDKLSHHSHGPGRKTLGIAYTPLHGVGAQVATAALTRAGFARVQVVEAQRNPDGAFPTVAYPNPEEPGSMDLVLALAEATGAALAVANDPDADRLAVAARDRLGTMRPLTGDELGVLLADDILSAAPPGALVGTTLVSARVLSRLAALHHAHYFETLTGFKWLAERARTAGANGQVFAFAYEEALGYAIGDVVWDKDGVSSLLAIAKLAAHLAENKQTLWCRLEDIARRVGIGVSAQRTIVLDAARARTHMQALRQNPPTQVGPWHLLRMEDLTVPADAQALGVPEANVVILHLRAQANDAESGFDPRIIVRPSGTEPKVKCYYDALVPLAPGERWTAAYAQALSALDRLMSAHARTLDDR